MRKNEKIDLTSIYIKSLFKTYIKYASDKLKKYTFRLKQI